MAKVTFIPTNPRKGRVQFSADELQLLASIAQVRIKDPGVSEHDAYKLAIIMMKLNRARNRLSAQEGN